MDGIELRIGYKEDLTENGLYWCFSRDMTLKEVKQNIQHSLKGTEREHFLTSLKIVLWKDWNRKVFYTRLRREQNTRANTRRVGGGDREDRRKDKNVENNTNRVSKKIM
ncbi:MAG: hypothetical protein ACFFCZ_29275 [Promethearchaeota archaeon]